MSEKRMGVEKFLTLYLKACEDGMGRDEFARKVGLKPATVYQRVAALRSQGLDIPVLAGPGRKSVLERAQALLAQHAKKSKPKQEVPVEDETEVEEDNPLADILG